MLETEIQDMAETAKINQTDLRNITRSLHSSTLKLRLDKARRKLVFNLNYRVGFRQALVRFF